jgi:hypothetical protein
LVFVAEARQGQKACVAVCQRRDAAIDARTKFSRVRHRQNGIGVAVASDITTPVKAAGPSRMHSAARIEDFN